MKLRSHTLLTGITVVALVALVASGSSLAVPASLRPQGEANLVVSRFLVAAALGDRTSACSLFPSYGACMRTALPAALPNSGSRVSRCPGQGVHR